MLPAGQVKNIIAGCATRTQLIARAKKVKPPAKAAR